MKSKRKQIICALLAALLLVPAVSQLPSVPGAIQAEAGVYIPSEHNYNYSANNVYVPVSYGPGVNNGYFPEHQSYTNHTYPPYHEGYGPGYGPGDNNRVSPNGTPVTASGWIQNGNKWYYRYANGNYARNVWDRIDGDWYYFDDDCAMHRGWLYYQNNWYYLHYQTGKMATGWHNVNEKWYYMNESGIMQTGYIQIDGKTYFTDSSGARVSNGYSPDGHLFDVDGVMVR